MIAVIVVGVMPGCKSDYAFWPAPAQAAPQAQAQTLPTPPASTVELESIAVGPPDTNVIAGSNLQFAATAVYSDGSRKDVTGSATWTSSNPSVASFPGSPNGWAAFPGAGSSEITASLAGTRGTTSVTVIPSTLLSIAILGLDSPLPKGAHQQLVVLAFYSGGSRQDVTPRVTWSSSSTSVAAVSATGQMTALSAGSTLVTANWQQLKAAGVATITPATLTAIEVTPTTSTLAKGTQESFVATGLYSDGTKLDLTNTVAWASSDGAIASIVDTPGAGAVATALSPASVRITASLAGVAGVAALSVTNASLVSIEVTPSNASVVNGSTVQFTATGVYTDHSTQDLTRMAVWGTSDLSVAAASNASGYEGLGTTLHPGQVSVTAKWRGVSGSTSLTVTAATLVSIGVTPANPSVANGTTKQFKATGVYTDGSSQDLTSTVTWQSATTSAASISNAAGSAGLATSVGIGSTTISATLGTVSGSTTMTVTAATLVSIGVTPANPSVPNGTTKQLKATGVYTDGTSQDLTTAVTWHSATAAVATISNAAGSNGLATPASAGSTVISATLGSVTGSTTLTVTGVTLVSLSMTPSNPTVANGRSQQFTATGTYSDGSTANLTALVTWSVADPSIAAISNAAGSNGLATASAVGSTQVTASSSVGVSASVMLTVSSSSAYVYTVNQGDNTVSEYTIGSGGVPAPMLPISTVSTGNTPSAMTIDPSGHYAYVPNQNDNTVSEYVIGASGALTPTGSVSSGSLPEGAVVDPTGRYLYVVNYLDQTISQYSIGSGGALTSMGTVDTGGAPFSIAVDPTGRYVYVANSTDNSISQYKITSGGVLAPNGTVNTGSYPVYITVDPTGRFVYTTDFLANAISQFSIGSGGALTAIGTGLVSAGGGPQAMMTDPAGQHAYAVNLFDNTVSEFVIGSDGALGSLGSAPTGAGPYSVTVEPTGRYVYVVNSTDATVSAYTMDGAGALTALGAPLASGGYPLVIVSGY
jgi:6-phosphogluconolactonase (cycloisomerase 2 family)